MTLSQFSSNGGAGLRRGGSGTIYFSSNPSALSTTTEVSNKPSATGKASLMFRLPETKKSLLIVRGNLTPIFVIFPIQITLL